MRGESDYAAADNFAGAVVSAGVVAITLLALVFWLAVRAVDQVIRAWRQCQGKSRALRIAVFSWLTCSGLIVLGLLLAAVPGTRGLAGSVGVSLFGCGSLWVVVTFGLVITARVVEAKYRQTFLAEPAPLVTQILHRPWWTSASRQAA